MPSRFWGMSSFPKLALSSSRVSAPRTTHANAGSTRSAAVSTLRIAARS
jgi:hypothetical protein